ncbi:MAG: gluconate 2-dehydrogenase subunit 3 family protein [Gemmatimonadaceae bacterium]
MTSPDTGGTTTGPAHTVVLPEPLAAPADRPPNAEYPLGTTQRLLTTDLVTTKTREVLEARIAAYEKPGAPEPHFFTTAEFATLGAVCTRLIPQPDREHPIDLAGAIDQRLAAGKGNGWRYDSMPPDGEAFRRAIQGLNEAACAVSTAAAGHSVEARFETLGGSEQDAVLAAVQRGDATGPVWSTMPSTRFFEELLTELASSYYSHPLGQDEIGFAGYADAHGWQRIGLNQLERFEPLALGEAPDPEAGGSNA